MSIVYDLLYKEVQFTKITAAASHQDCRQPDKSVNHAMSDHC